LIDAQVAGAPRTLPLAVPYTQLQTAIGKKVGADVSTHLGTGDQTENVGQKKGISYFSVPHFLFGQAPANLSPIEGVYHTLLISMRHPNYR
jgi:hypothetical protein